MVIHPVVHLVCDRVGPEECRPANSPELGSQAWVCPRTGHAMGHRSVHQLPPSTRQVMKFGKRRWGKDRVETSTAAALPEQGLEPWGSGRALGRGPSGWLRTSLPTGAHRANMLQRLFHEKVQSCGVRHLLWLHCFARTCCWRWLVWFFHLDGWKPQRVHFLLQIEEELNPVLKWGRDLVILLCASLFSDTKSSLLS